MQIHCEPRQGRHRSNTASRPNSMSFPVASRDGFLPPSNRMQRHILNTFIFILTRGSFNGIFLNVFKSSTNKGKTSKAQLLTISLDLFRTKGFDATTMRDIAGAAGMSLGAFYYYYPSKDSII